MYFDAGCAKGFLIRALRDAGREARGCDISEWALSRADEETRQFISLAAAEDADWLDEHDVLTAFHLLAQMTEAQIDRFLSNARLRTRIGITAVIPLLRSDGTAPAGDLGHITWRDRSWWHERFLNAGWRQDPLHQAMEKACQRQPLPQRMGWEIFLYTAGR